MLVDKELVSIVSEKVTETFDVIETEVSPSEGELDDTVGGVVSVVVVLSVLFEPSSLLHEMTERLKRSKEKMMSICLTWFPISGLGKHKLYLNLGDFTRKWEDCGVVSDCEELVGGTHLVKSDAFPIYHSPRKKAYPPARLCEFYC